MSKVDSKEEFPRPQNKLVQAFKVLQTEPEGLFDFLIGPYCEDVATKLCFCLAYPRANQFYTCNSCLNFGEKIYEDNTTILGYVSACQRALPHIKKYFAETPVSVSDLQFGPLGSIHKNCLYFEFTWGGSAPPDKPWLGKK